MQRLNNYKFSIDLLQLDKCVALHSTMWNIYHVEVFYSQVFARKGQRKTRELSQGDFDFFISRIKQEL